MKTRNYQSYLFTLLALVYMLPSLQGVIMTVVAKDIMDDLGVSPHQLGFLGSSYLYAYAASMLVSGMVSAFFGPRRTLAIMFAIASAGGFITCYSSSFLLACVGRALTGLGTAVVLTSSLTLFSRWYKAERYSALCAAFFSVGGVGALIGAWPLSLFNAGYGWRMTFLLIAVITLVYSILVYASVRDWPSADAEKEIGVVASPRTPITLTMMYSGLQKIVKHGDFWKLSLWFVGMSGMYLSFVGLWAIPYFIDVHKFSNATAGLVVSMFSFGFILGNPLLSFLCDKVLHSNRIALGASGVVGLVGALILLLGGASLNLPLCIVLALTLGMAVNAPNAIVYSSARNVLGSRLASVASGVMACMCFISGGAFQVLCGSAIDFGAVSEISIENTYLAAFLPAYCFCFILAAWAGFSLSRASDPGHISPFSLRKLSDKARHP